MPVLWPTEHRTKTLNMRIHSNINALTKACLFFGLLGFSGCNTLSSLGLPFGGGSNKLLKSAQAISETPAHAILAPKELGKMPLDSYVVEVGDTVLIEPVKFDSTIRLPGDQVVKPDGCISIGEFGRYEACNKTIDQIQLDVQATIDNHIRQDFEIAYEVERRHRDEDEAYQASLETADLGQVENDSDDDKTDLKLRTDETREERIQLNRRIEEAIGKNQISARIVNWDSKKIYVLGEVNSPGSFNYSGHQTVLDALIEAGGINSKANKHQIIVSRPSSCSDCRVVMKVCYDQVVQLGDASTNYQLQPGDRVFVPTLTFAEDLKKSLNGNKDVRCPRCADCDRGCSLPEGCE